MVDVLGPILYDISQFVYITFTGVIINFSIMCDILFNLSTQRHQTFYRFWSFKLGLEKAIIFLYSDRLFVQFEVVV